MRNLETAPVILRDTASTGAGLLAQSMLEKRFPGR